MGWELKGKPATVKVTTKLAKEFAEMEAAHVDRPLSERRLQVYRKVRADGGFRPVTWAKAWCKDTSQFYRVNGKHTSTLFSDGENPDGLFVTIEEYVCDTLEDVAKLYATFDSQSQTRNATDVNRSFAAVIPELAQIPFTTINLLVGGLNYEPASHAGGSYRAQPAERAEALFDNVDVCVWLLGILGTDRKANPHIWRVPVVAAMVSTYRKAQKAALEFWTAVRDETGVKPDLPDRRLAKFLSITVSDQGAHSTAASKRFRITSREYFVKCIHAWNAWRKNESTQLNYHVNAKVPALV